MLENGRYTMLRTMRTVVVLSAGVMFTAAIACAGGSPSVEQGKQLFNNSSLGTSGKSCSTCHPGGRGLHESASLATHELEKMSNQCIQKALKGQPLAVGSAELSSLVMYLKSLGTAQPK